MADEHIPQIKDYPDLGELTIGGGTAEKIIVVALCRLDDPLINEYFLDNKLKLVDRITKTKIFPREGMALPEGQTYEEPAEDTE